LVTTDTPAAHALLNRLAEDFAKYMNSIKSIRIIKSLALVFTVALAVVLVSSSSVAAQGRGNGRGHDRYDDRSDRDRDDDRYDRDDDDRYDRNRNNGYYGRQDDRYNGRDRNGNQSVRFAYKRGYQAGRQQAREDIRNRRGRYPTTGSYGNYGGYGSYGGYGNNGQYGRGNRNGWGNSPEFQQAYRDGYSRGYQEEINRGRYNNRNGNWRNQIPFPLPF
jgi:hypothetical protein